jgi:hypothetical protein
MAMPAGVRTLLWPPPQLSTIAAPEVFGRTGGPVGDRDGDSVLAAEVDVEGRGPVDHVARHPAPP